MADTTLIVLTGPVGGGKSTVALSLAEHLRSQGCPTAVIDLDLVYQMARQRHGFDDERVWSVARQGAAALVSSFFSNGRQPVIVEGGFFTREEYEDLRIGVSSDTDASLVTLNVSFEQALQRAQSDPNRTVSRDPEFLRTLHDQFTEALPFLRANGIVLDADQRSPGELARLIAQVIFEADD